MVKKGLRNEHCSVPQTVANGFRGRLSQVRILQGTLVHQLYTSAGTYGRVLVGTPSLKSAYSSGSAHHNEPRRSIQIALVMRLGQRFESARRLFIFALSKPNSRKGVTLGSSPRASLHHPYITETGPLRYRPWACIQGIHQVLDI